MSESSSTSRTRPSRLTRSRAVLAGVVLALAVPALLTSGSAGAASAVSSGWRAQHTLAGSQCAPFTNGAQAPYRPTNGTATSWSKLGMKSNCLVWTAYGIGSNGLGTVIAVGDQNFRARWTSGGTSATHNSQPFSGSLNTYNDVAANGTNWVAVGNIGRIRYSADDGVSWSSASTPGGVPALSFVAQHHGTWIAGGGTAKLLWRSTDNGRTWSNVSVPGSGHAFGDLVTFTGATYDVVSGKWFASGWYGEIWTSSNDGQSWTLSWDNASDDFWTDIDAAADGTVIASSAGWGKIARTTNGGTGWTPFNIGPGLLKDASFNGIKAGPDGEWMAVGLANRVYYSLDKGVTWTPSSGLPSLRTWNDVTHVSVAD